MTEYEKHSFINLLSSDNKEDRLLSLEIMEGSSDISSGEFLFIWNEAILKSNENWDSYMDIIDRIGRLAWKLRKRETLNSLINTQ